MGKGKDHRGQALMQLPLRERSGVPELDRAIEAYLNMVATRLLRDPEYTTDQCYEVSQHCLEFLRAQGFEAYLATETADDHGYLDRTSNGSGWRWHTLVVVPLDSESFALDFTAAQYGYRALPLVQRLPYSLNQPDYEHPRETNPAAVEPLEWQRSW